MGGRDSPPCRNPSSACGVQRFSSLTEIQLPLSTKPLLDGCADGTGLIVLRTHAGIFAVDLKPGEIKEAWKGAGYRTPVVPYTSFCIPGTDSLNFCFAWFDKYYVVLPSSDSKLEIQAIMLLVDYPLNCQYMRVLHRDLFFYHIMLTDRLWVFITDVHFRLCQ